MLDEGYRPVPAVKQIISLSGEKKRRVVIHSPNDLCTSSRHKPDMAGQKLQKLATFQPGDNFSVVIQSDLVKRSERGFVRTTSSMHPVDDYLISDAPKRINGISGYPEF